jgi:hypothetical protein
MSLVNWPESPTQRRPFPGRGGWPDVDGPIGGFPPVGGGMGQPIPTPFPNPEPDRPWNDYRAESWPPIGPGGGVQPVPTPLPGPGSQTPPNFPAPVPAPETETLPVPAPEEQGTLGKGKEFLIDWIKKNPGLIGSILGGGAGTYIGKKTGLPGGGLLGGLAGGFIGGRIGKNVGKRWQEQPAVPMLQG